MMCEHTDRYEPMVRPGTFSSLVFAKPSLARAWQTVYDHPEGTLPGNRIGPKDCACCEKREFTENDDYICLWCRYAELVDE